jgi:signal peptidase II
MFATKTGRFLSMTNLLKHLSLLLGLLVLNFSFHFLLKGQNLDLGLLKIALVFNTGFIFGLYNEASSLIRIVFTSVFMGILSLIACYFYAFLHPQLKRLRWGITVTLAGILGNGLEKLIYGYVWDYLNLNLPFLSQFTFNLNDLLQIIGLILMATEIFHKQDLIWFPDVSRRRNTFIIYRDIQLPIVYKITGLIFIGSLTQGILTVALLFPHLRRGSQDMQVLFFLSLLLLNLGLLPLLGMYLLKELMRCLGPVYALEKFLNSESEAQKELKFRKNDHFHSLAQAFNDFIRKK